MAWFPAGKLDGARSAARFPSRDARTPTVLPISCVLPVYSGVSLDEFTRAYRSITHQTRRPEEILVVLDGPVREGVEEFLESQAGPRLTVVRFAENGGVAAAMREAFVRARNRWVARHDADDIMMPDRLEKQWPVVSTGRYAAVSGVVVEFVGSPDDIVGVRRLPAEPDAVARYATINSPLNNPAAIFDRDAVLEVGNVRDILYMEDYELSARLIARGYELRNLDEVLTLQHTPESMYDRRTDARLAVAEKEMQRTLVELGLVSRPRALANYAARQTFRSLPRPLLKRAYTVLFHRPGALDAPISEVRGWLDSGWPGFEAEPRETAAS